MKGAKGRLAAFASRQEPFATSAPRVLATVASSAASLVLPIPASPPSSTRPGSPCLAASRQATSRARSATRPTNTELEIRRTTGSIMALSGLSFNGLPSGRVRQGIRRGRARSRARTSGGPSAGSSSGSLARGRLLGRGRRRRGCLADLTPPTRGPCHLRVPRPARRRDLADPRARGRGPGLLCVQGDCPALRPADPVSRLEPRQRPRPSAGGSHVPARALGCPHARRPSPSPPSPPSSCSLRLLRRHVAVGLVAGDCHQQPDGTGVRDHAEAHLLSAGR